MKWQCEAWSRWEGARRVASGGRGTGRRRGAGGLRPVARASPSSSARGPGCGVWSLAPQQVAVPWAEPRARFARLFERLALDVLLECSVLGAGNVLESIWAEADGIKQRAVVR